MATGYTSLGSQPFPPYISSRPREIFLLDMPPRFSVYTIGAAFFLIAVCGSTQDPPPGDDDRAGELPQQLPVALTLPASPGSLPDLEPTVDTARLTVSAATSTASEQALGRRNIPVETLNYRQILDPERDIDESLSRGTIRDGRLRNGAPLAEVGDHHEILPAVRNRNTQFGTAELVGAIERAAAAVAEEYGGAPLRVGNLGFQRGGPIPWSASHQAGRDADIAFYVLTQDGESIPAPGLIEFDDEGIASDEQLQFDIPRNWALVRALLSDPEIKVQWLFVSEGLKSLLLLHAIDIGESPDLLRRASKVLHQPTDAAPHDDHLHLRIGCARTDRLEGCLDWGPQWDWHDWQEDALFARTRALQPAFADPDPEIRRRALAYLQRIRSPFAAETALHFGIYDDDEEVRNKAYDLLLEIPLQTPAGIKALASAMDGDDIGEEHQQTLYRALRRATTPAATTLAWERYANTDLDDRERARAIRALANRMKPELVPRLIDALADEDSPVLRQNLARQLRRISARTDGLDWSDHPPTDEHQKALAEWRRWWDDIEPDRRDMLLALAGEYGAEHWKDLEVIDDLIPLLRGAPDYKRYNLNRILSQWTGRWAPREWEHEADAHRFWTNWWNRNRDRVLDDTPWPWEEALADP